MDISENRELITTNVSGWIQKITDLLPRTDSEIRSLFNRVEEFGQGVADAVDQVGGISNVLIVMGGIMAGPAIASVLGLAKAIGTLGAVMLGSPLGQFVTVLALGALATKELIDTYDVKEHGKSFNTGENYSQWYDAMGDQATPGSLGAQALDRQQLVDQIAQAGLIIGAGSKHNRVAAMISTLRKIHNKPVHNCRWLELAFSTLVGGVAALAALAFLPLVFGADISPKIEIAFAALAGSYGQKTFDIIVHKIIGEKPVHGDKD